MALADAPAVRIVTRRAAVDADRSLTPEGKAKRRVGLAQREAASAEVQQLTRERGSRRRRVAQRETELSALTLPSVDPYAEREIRDRLLAMPNPNARDGVVWEAWRMGDLVTVAAAKRAPASFPVVSDTVWTRIRQAQLDRPDAELAVARTQLAVVETLLDGVNELIVELRSTSDRPAPLRSMPDRSVVPVNS